MRDLSRIKSGKPYIRFYWFINAQAEIVGTIRYRKNIPEEYGNIGFEIAPSFRNNSYGKMMLINLLKILKEEQIESLNITALEQNLVSNGLILSCGGRFVKKLSIRNSILNIYNVQL